MSKSIELYRLVNIKFQIGFSTNRLMVSYLTARIKLFWMGKKLNGKDQHSCASFCLHFQILCFELVCSYKQRCVKTVEIATKILSRVTLQMDVMLLIENTWIYFQSGATSVSISIFQHKIQSHVIRMRHQSPYCRQHVWQKSETLLLFCVSHIFTKTTSLYI